MGSAVDGNILPYPNALFALYAGRDFDRTLAMIRGSSKSSMKRRHTAALALLAWTLLLDTSPDRHGFNEWAGAFSTRKKCEYALSREQTHSYDMNPDEPDAHAPGRKPIWVKGLPGLCTSEDEIWGPPAPSAKPTSN